MVAAPHKNIQDYKNVKFTGEETFIQYLFSESVSGFASVSKGHFPEHE